MKVKPFAALLLMALLPHIASAEFDPKELEHLQKTNSGNFATGMVRLRDDYRRGLASQVAFADRIELLQLSSNPPPPNPESPNGPDENAVLKVGQLQYTILKRRDLNPKELSFFKTEMPRLLQVTETPSREALGPPTYGCRLWFKGKLFLSTVFSSENPKELWFALDYPYTGIGTTAAQNPTAMLALLAQPFPAPPAAPKK